MPLFDVRIHLTDARVTTVAEWRANMDANLLPAAVLWLKQHPYTQEDFADIRAAADAAAAGLVVFDANGIKQPVDPAAKETADVVFAEARVLLADRGIKPSVESEWAWYTKVVADAQRSDAEMEAEFAEKDRQGCYKSGYIVDVHPTGWEWSEDEVGGGYAIVQVDANDLDDFAPYQAPLFGTRVVEGEEHRVLVARRAFRVDVAALAGRTALAWEEFVAVIV